MLPYFPKKPTKSWNVRSVLSFRLGNAPNTDIGELLVSTYVVCERLSVMQRQAGLVENLVQKSQFTLF